MKSKKGIVTILQVGVIIASIGGFYVFNQKEVKPIVVYTFNKNLPANSQITAEDLNKVNIPAKAVNETFELDVNNLIGKYVSTDVFNGEYAIRPNIAEATELNPLEDIDLSKYRKISLPINYTDGVGGEIKSGDKIDLAYIGKGTKTSQDVTQSGEFTYSKVFLQDVIVYNVVTANGTNYVSKSESEIATNGKGKSIETGEGGGDLSTIILAVTAEQAEEILARQKTGEVRPIGRFIDSENYNTSGFTYGASENINTSATDPEM